MLAHKQDNCTGGDGTHGVPFACRMSGSAAARVLSGRVRKIGGMSKACPQPLDPKSCLTHQKKGMRAIKIQPKEEKQTLEPG